MERREQLEDFRVHDARGHAARRVRRSARLVFAYAQCIPAEPTVDLPHDLAASCDLRHYRRRAGYGEFRAVTGVD